MVEVLGLLPVAQFSPYSNSAYALKLAAEIGLDADTCGEGNNMHVRSRHRNMGDTVVCLLISKVWQHQLIPQLGLTTFSVHSAGAISLFRQESGTPRMVSTYICIVHIYPAVKSACLWTHSPLLLTQGGSF